MKSSLVILAAGVGSRYGGLKQIDKLGPTGETIIDYSVYDAMKAGFGKVVFVIRKSIENDFKEAIADKYSGKIDIDYVLQELEYVPDGVNVTPERIKPWGTGHAIMMAVDKINEPFAVINGDDFYGSDAFITMANYLKNIPQGNTTNYSMVGYRLGSTLSENGYVSRGVCTTDNNGLLVDIEENTKIQRINGVIKSFINDEKSVELDENVPVSMNFWGFVPSVFEHLNNLFKDFIKDNSTNLKSEFYIPYAVNDLIKQGKAQAMVLDSKAEWFGVTYQEDRPLVVKKLKELHENKIYPTPLWK